MKRKIKFEKLQYAVKIDINNDYIIFPHNNLKAIYSTENNKNTINIITIGKHQLILQLNCDEIIDISYKDKNMDIVDYINKQL